MVGLLLLPRDPRIVENKHSKEKALNFLIGLILSG